MTAPYKYFLDLAREAEPPADGILSRTLYQDDKLKAVLFGFAPDQELSEHTASSPAILHVIHGKATLLLGKDTVEAVPGTWVHLAAQLPHSVHAKTPLVMLLLLLKH